MTLNWRENFVRHVGGSHVDDGIVNGSAFERASKDTDGLSIVRRKIFAKSTEVDLRKIREALGSRRALGKTSVFAELNVGTALEILHEFDNRIDIIADPLPEDGGYIANPAHALILELPIKGLEAGSLDSELAGDLLAAKILSLNPGAI